MADSKNIAGLLGPTLIAIAATEAMNLDLLTMFAGPSHAPIVYLNGTLLFVSGLSIVRAHNRWTGGWPVLITLIGWFVLIGGLIRMAAPLAAQRAQQNRAVVFALLIVLFAIGIFLTFKSYVREDGGS